VRYSNRVGMPMKLVTIIDICLNETYNEVCMGISCVMHLILRIVFKKKILSGIAFQLCFRLHY
jgi:hypothetical protein